MDSNETTKAEEPALNEDAAPGVVKWGGALVAILILLTLTWYLAADRYTPYTDQARIQGYVIGVAPQVSGVVREVWVENNQSVNEGDRLFKIDPNQYEIALSRAQSDLENTLRQVDAGSAAVDAARANLRAAQANQEKAEKDTSRLERLRADDPGTISVRRLEISRATLDQSKAGVAAAEADIQRAIEQKGGGKGEINTLVQVAQTAVEKAQLDLERTVVRASSRGVITDLRADIGLYAGAGTPVMTLVAVRDVWVRAEYTENNLGNMRPGTPVELIFDILPGRVFKGEVRSIGLGISTGSTAPAGTLPTIDNSRDWLRQSQRFPVNIGFDVTQDETLLARLRVGGQASVMAYSDEGGLLTWLGKLYIRLMSVMSYAY
ncbi:HlyD family secretion protein [Halieaceae bacterium IMCC14734]|uniref:HlyD family secretion protein n=1 Tax=Candidatus Litorirhabdus singularis TaxID=2518993 RepID=A0ABT3TJZ3_9GAMM|nr:HlyD family secretion protein [Candidatus Litorirhabdus singularis]MCX2982545.1 HlyD family secretion protein [Candidatus Litorirhabdus singularis]